MTNLQFDFNEVDTEIKDKIEPFLKQCMDNSKAVEKELILKPYLRLIPGRKKGSTNEDDYENIGWVGKCYKDTWFRLITNQKKIYRFQLKVADYQLRKKIISELPEKSEYKIVQQYYLSFDLEKNDNLLLKLLKSMKTALSDSYNYLCENEKVPLVYGCCSKYLECSNAKKCIQESINVKYAKGCDYRKNLKNGKIFYGKNKNN